MIKKLLEELSQNKNFIKLKSEHPNLFFCAAFIVTDFEAKTSKTQLDFFLPSERKIVAFEHPFIDGKKYDDEIIEMKEQPTEIKIDKSDLEEFVRKSVEKNGSKIIPAKIIAILKNDEWNITAMNNALGIARIRINAQTGEEISFNKGSLMDFMGIEKNKQ